MTEPQVRGTDNLLTQAGREVHTLLHRLSSQMKTCEMVPCPFAGLARRTEVEAREAARDEGRREAVNWSAFARAMKRVAQHNSKGRIYSGPQTLAAIRYEYDRLVADLNASESDRRSATDE